MENTLEFTIKDEGLKLFFEKHVINNDKRDRDFETESPYYKMKDELFIKKSEELKENTVVRILLIDNNRFKSKILTHEYTYTITSYDSVCNKMELTNFTVISAIKQ